MLQSSHRFGLPASSPNLSESGLAGWAEVLGCAALTRARMRALTAHPPNWIQRNFTTRRRTNPVGSIESCMQGVGAPPQTPRRLSRKNVAGGSAPRPPPERGLGWGGAPAGVWGQSPQLHSCGEAAPGFGTEPQLPAYDDSIKPIGLVRREEPNLSEPSPAGGL